MNSKAAIGLMVGDPCGVGPEVCVKALLDPGAQSLAANVLVIGSAAAVRAALAQAGADDWQCRVIADAAQAAFEPKVVEVLDPGTLAESDIRLGEVSAACGAAVFEWTQLADRLSREGAIRGWIMAPVSVEALSAAGAANSIDDLQPPGSFLFRISGNLRVIALSEHIPLRSVPDDVTKDHILELLSLFDSTARVWGMTGLRYAVAGLNPHAAGAEEAAEIGPAVAEARARGFEISGPLPPDSVFRRCVEGHFDVVVSMYHDQGQIALKTAAFVGACTIYVGAPHIRMTVPHGTALDIAGRGIARHESILTALQTAANMAAGRGLSSAPTDGGRHGELIR